MKLDSFILTVILFASNSCQSQTSQLMNDTKNPLICDPAIGSCEIPEANESTTEVAQLNEKQLKVVYFTDPICSSCWGIEPQLRKLKLEYGHVLEIEYRMGGLLPDWSYNSGGISKPSDVAHHWDEVSIHYDMPIDGDVWLEDPLPSSYPPSIAYKAAQMQDQLKANAFLREIREMVFLEKKNITKWIHLEEAAQKAGLDIEQFTLDFQGPAKTLFEEDLQLAKEFGVRGFPTMFFVGNAGQQEKVYGSKPYVVYETAIRKTHPNVEKSEYSKSWEALFHKYQSLTAREFSELSGTPRNESESFLNTLTENQQLEKLETKNGSIWSVKASSR